MIHLSPQRIAEHPLCRLQDSESDPSSMGSHLPRSDVVMRAQVAEATYESPECGFKTDV
jgi:hypothetical protein